MNSDYKDKRPFLESVFRSFQYALEGIIQSVRKERNLKIHLVISVLVIVLGVILQLTYIEWLFVVFAIGGMISFELLNTAIERAVDMVTSEYHPLAKQAKDAAAGAVFVYAILSVVVGLIIFVPKIINFIK